MRRVQGAEPGQAHWQSVTGSLDALDEPWHIAAAREVMEETGFDVQASGVVLRDWGLENVYPLYPAWRHRYAPGVFFNRERVFGLCLPQAWTPRLSAREHNAYCWLEHRQAAQRCVSPSNAEAILWLSHGFAAESAQEGL